MHTPEEVAAFKEKYAQRRRRQLLATIPAVAAVVALLFLNDRPKDILGLESNVVSTVVIMVIVGLVAFSFFNWRCPACNGYFGKVWNPAFCSKCGVGLR